MDPRGIVLLAPLPNAGATRFCMGAAWRHAPEGDSSFSTLASVIAVAALGVEVCCNAGHAHGITALGLKQPALLHTHNWILPP